MKLDRNKILVLMARKGLSGTALATKMGMRRQGFSAFFVKACQTKNSRPETVHKIATALDVDVTAILEG